MWACHVLKQVLVKDPANGEDCLKLARLRATIVLSWSVYLHSDVVSHRGALCVCLCGNVSHLLDCMQRKWMLAAFSREILLWRPFGAHRIGGRLKNLAGKTYRKKDPKRCFSIIARNSVVRILSLLDKRCSYRHSSSIFWGKVLSTCFWFAPDGVQAGARILDRQCTGPFITGIGQTSLNVFPYPLVLWRDSSNLGFCDGKWQSKFHQDWI